MSANKTDKFPPVFNIDDYAAWAFDMESFMRAKEVWIAITRNQEFWAHGHGTRGRKSQKAFDYLRLALGETYRHVLQGQNHNRPDRVWDSIWEQYGGITTTQRLALEDEIARLELGSMTVDEYIAKGYKLKESLRIAGRDLTEIDLFIRLLQGLPNEAYEIEKAHMRLWTTPTIN
jgi:hypothetical protein